jgi:hypothetical protein
VDDEPHTLVIRLPSGRVLENISKATLFGQREGIVQDAEFLPHPGQLALQDAIRLVEMLLEKFDAVPDERSKKLIAEWKTEGEAIPDQWAQRRGNAKLKGEEKAFVEFSIKPGKRGWVVWVMVGATMEERRRISGLPAVPPATNQSATKPSTRPSD